MLCGRRLAACVARICWSYKGSKEMAITKQHGLSESYIASVWRIGLSSRAPSFLALFTAKGRSIVASCLDFGHPRLPNPGLSRDMLLIIYHALRTCLLFSLLGRVKLRRLHINLPRALAIAVINCNGQTASADSYSVDHDCLI